MTTKVADLARQLLDAARKAGAEAADVVAIESESTDVEVRNGALEAAGRTEETELGLRVLIGNRQACVAATGRDTDAFAAMAGRAVDMARVAPDDPHVGLADPSILGSGADPASLDLVDPAEGLDPDALRDHALSAEAAALAVPGISQSLSASAGQNRTSSWYAATNGVDAGRDYTQSYISAAVITGEGTAMERDYASEVRSHFSDLPEAAEIGHLAGERTIARAGARKPPTGAYPILYDERVAAGLIGHLLQAVDGAAVARGASWLRGAIGAEVLPAGIDLIEDPHRTRITASRTFDAEGLPTFVRKIVDDGRLAGFTLDLATARKLGLQSTASARRNPGSPPTPGLAGITLTSGTATRDDLLSDMGTGLLVTSMIGSSINPTTGDYSRGASGFWVENGEISYPVNECTLAGNLREMLRTIKPANDARRHATRVVPSLLVEGLMLAGA
ncbi:MAG: TldD/PmbA family protein [Pseudomonadota bacterium]